MGVAPDLETPGERLRWARERAGYADAAAFARAAGIKPVTYRAYEANQNHFRKHVVEFADLLGVSANWLLRGGDRDAPGAEDESTFVKVIGAVRAGSWHEGREWPPEEQYEVDFGPAALRGYPRFGLVVEGYSMDKIFPPGTELECYWTKFQNRPLLTPQDGDLVIVERRDGDRYETTCKRLRIWPTGEAELHAESTRPEFSEPIVLGRPDIDQHIDIETEIIGIVDRAVQQHFRRARRR